MSNPESEENFALTKEFLNVFLPRYQRIMEEGPAYDAVAETFTLLITPGAALANDLKDLIINQVKAYLATVQQT